MQVEPGAAPATARVRWLGSSQELDADDSWSALFRPSPTPALLRVDFPPVAPGFRRLRVDRWPSGPQSLVLAIVPRVPLPQSVYDDALDLLQELILPLTGTVIRRWRRSTLRVAMPSGEFEVDYAGSLRDALELWNRLLGIERFIATAPGAEADVKCDVGPETALAYTQLLDRDETLHPRAMRVHLSPRWTAGAERYVRRTWIHELGHVLGLWGHSRQLGHIMSGQAVITDEPSPEEIRVARWLWALPDGFDLVWLGASSHPTPHHPPLWPAITGCAAARGGDTAATRPW